MKTIVLLSTNDLILQHLTQKLQDLSFNVKAVNNCDDVFGQIRMEKPDLLIIDFILREGNGGSICHQIKCDSLTKNLPVILFSEHTELLPFLKKFGCDESIAKPFDTIELQSAIVRCLNKGSKLDHSRKMEKGAKLDVQLHY